MDDGRRDDWKKADTEDTVSPCTPSEDLEDLERNRRNDSDVGTAERLSSLERKKRAVLKFIGSCRYLAFRKGFSSDGACGGRGKDFTESPQRCC